MKERKIIRNLDGGYWNKEKQGFVGSDEATIFESFSKAYLELPMATKYSPCVMDSVWVNEITAL